MPPDGLRGGDLAAGPGSVWPGRPCRRRLGPQGRGTGVCAMHARQRPDQLPGPGPQRPIGRRARSVRPERPQGQGGDREVPHPAAGWRPAQRSEPGGGPAAGRVRAVHARQRCARLPGPERRRLVPPERGAGSAQRSQLPEGVREMPEEPSPARRMRHQAMIPAVAGAAAVLLAGGFAGGAVLSRGAAAEPGAQTRLPPATAEVTRTTLVDTMTVPGTLGYGEEVPIATTGDGTLTWIAPTGSTVG